MSDLPLLLERFFLEPFDIAMPGEQVPHTSSGNYVTHLIDGHTYFGALREELEALEIEKKHPYFYFANWWLGLAEGPRKITSDAGPITSAWAQDAQLAGLPAFVLEDGTGTNSELMIDQLARLAKGLVDVRGLVWVSPFMTHEQLGRNVTSIWAVNIHSLISARQLRKAYPLLKDKVVLNTLAHPLGGMHLKLVICGNDERMSAYVGGMDLVSNRVAGSLHPPGQSWHDAAVRLVGPAAGAVYNFYRSLWNEQIARPPRRFLVESEVTKTHDRRGDFGAGALESNGTPELPARDAPQLQIPGEQHVQVLITLPQMNFVSEETETVPLDCKKRIILGFARDKLSFAPEGRFEFRAGLKKAIFNAQKFIYVEDQSFTAFEAMDWINQLLRATTGIKVILVWGADPADPPHPYTTESIANHLLPGVTNAGSRVAFYARSGITVHSKVVVIDDEWASVGTANFMRRSLYTDGEVAVSVVDSAEPSFARRLRKDLWGDACGLLPGVSSDVLLDLNKALGVWDSSWGARPAGVSLRPEFTRMKVPLEFAPVPGPGQFLGNGLPIFDHTSQIQYDWFDPDSRKVF